MYLALPRHASAVISFLSFLKQTIAVFIDHLKRIFRMYLMRIVQYIMHNTEEPLLGSKLYVDHFHFFYKCIKSLNSHRAIWIVLLEGICRWFPELNCPSRRGRTGLWMTLTFPKIMFNNGWSRKGKLRNYVVYKKKRFLGT